MVSSLEDIRTNRRIMAYTAAAIYGIAGLDGAIEGFLPGDPPFSMLPVVVVFILFFALMAVGQRFPRWALAVLGPLGVVLIAYALSTSPGPGTAPFCTRCRSSGPPSSSVGAARPQSSSASPWGTRSPCSRCRPPTPIPAAGST